LKNVPVCPRRYAVGLRDIDRAAKWTPVRARTRNERSSSRRWKARTFHSGTGATACSPKREECASIAVIVSENISRVNIADNNAIYHSSKNSPFHTGCFFFSPFFFFSLFHYFKFFLLLLRNRVVRRNEKLLKIVRVLVHTDIIVECARLGVKNVENADSKLVIFIRTTTRRTDSEVFVYICTFSAVFIHYSSVNRNNWIALFVRDCFPAVRIIIGINF